VSGYVERNRRAWAGFAEEFAAAGRRNWEQAEFDWGIWDIPESELGVLPDVGGKDVVELGCGTAYFSAWLARQGARVTGVDLTPEQLETARALQAEHGLEFPLVEANAEDVPLPDASFDLAVSEYGASIWADPYRWIPEAARLLRPGGELVFLTNGLPLVLCWDDADPEAAAGDELVRDYFGLHTVDDASDGTTTFQLPYGAWIRLFREHGLSVENLVEIQAPVDGDAGRWDFVTPEWARRWPSEEIWRVRKAAA
jgi:SAM-dependent methyltransferase